MSILWEEVATESLGWNDWIFIFDGIEFSTSIASNECKYNFKF